MHVQRLAQRGQESSVVHHRLEHHCVDGTARHGCHPQQSLGGVGQGRRPREQDIAERLGQPALGRLGSE